jgi:TATA-box binding protein (TBP) (component of TFIID and TFIIIB)
VKWPQPLSVCVLVSAIEMVGAVSQLSAGVGEPGEGTLAQLTVVSAGTPLSTGAVVSCTWIVWLALLLLPQASVAVQVRVTLYEPAQAPGVVTSADVRVNALPQASEAVATANTGVFGQSIVAGDGKEAITGAVTSCTLIVWLALLLLPQASVAVQVRVTLYEPAQAPGVVTSADVKDGEASQLSVAVATAKLGVAGQSMVVRAGRAAITGAVVSTNLICWTAVASLPFASWAFQVRSIPAFPVQLAATAASE